MKQAAYPGKKGSPPSGTLRGSQIVTTFGPGSLVDLVDQAVMVGGMEFWCNGGERYGDAVQEPRLRQSLSYKMEAWGSPLRSDRPFVAPPVGDDRFPSRNQGIQVLEFPRWLVCQEPSCRALAIIGSGALELKKSRYYHRCENGELELAVPVRFVAACQAGHIEDFPWRLFVHQKSTQPSCKGQSIALTQGPGGDIGDVTVVCHACGAQRSMLEAQGKHMGLNCQGKRPWLGDEPNEDCTNSLSLLVRTASNGYFAQVVSAISIPPKEDAVADLVETAWGYLANIEDASSLAVVRKMPSFDMKLARYTDEELLKAIKQRRAQAKVMPLPLKYAEWNHLISVPSDPTASQVPPPGAVFFARKAPDTVKLPAAVELTLVRRLREVRVQVGFTRLQATGIDMLGEIDKETKPAALSIEARCLPAVELKGEGLFFRLNEDALRAWEKRPAVRDREKLLEQGHAAWFATLERPSAAHKFRGVRFYMLHTLSHLLMSAISLECGYAASAIRERLYCSSPDGGKQGAMAGILLSTGSPGSEGTLGGLVDQYRHMDRHLRRAFDLGSLCSNDPVCALHRPDHAGGERHLEGSACHGCLHVAECSCECFNEYLDRALVFPILGQGKELSFFPSKP